jgi:hypothetical protein
LEIVVTPKVINWEKIKCLIIKRALETVTIEGLLKATLTESVSTAESQGFSVFKIICFPANLTSEKNLVRVSVNCVPIVFIYFIL